MLQQILATMHIDAELLAHMSEEDRHRLFHKMRDEQVRRWEAWQDQLEREESQRRKPKLPPKPGKKRVNFLLGADGNPWTTVIDDDDVNVKYQESNVTSTITTSSQDDDNDMDANRNNAGGVMASLALPLKDETTTSVICSPSMKRKPSLEAVQLRGRGKDVNLELHEDKVVQEALSRAQRLSQMWDKQNSAGATPPPLEPHNQHVVPPEKPANATVASAASDEPDRTSWLHTKQQEKLKMQWKPNDQAAGRMAPANGPEESSTMPEVKQVYAQLRNTQKKCTEMQNSIRLSIESEESLRERDKTNPETVKKISEIARKARQELEEQTTIANKNHRNLTNTTTTRAATLQVTRSLSRPSKPPSRSAIVEWFRSEERPKGTGLDTAGRRVATWFHGMISRSEAEELLLKQPTGTFLVRFCERIWGYAISRRTEFKCKHYLIEIAAGNYQFLGESSMKFCKMADLIRYYQVQPITHLGHDCLVMPCPNLNEDTIYKELFA